MPVGWARGGPFHASLGFEKANDVAFKKMERGETGSRAGVLYNGRWTTVAYGVAAAVLALVVVGTYSSIVVADADRRFVNTLRDRANWEMASLASRFRRVPRSGDALDLTDERDEYGHLTFTAACKALHERGIDPRWPLLPGAWDARRLCEAMQVLPARLRVYAFGLPRAAHNRYWLTSLLPTFNRGYDVEGHLVEGMQRTPFAVKDPSLATAFLIPTRPYLERVSSFPSNGRREQLSHVRSVVERIKVNEPEAWALSEPGCSRVMVNTHDTGSFVAQHADPAVRERGVFIVSNSDSTDEETAEKNSRNGESMFRPEKDVAAVASLSFHIPKDAVAMGAVVPLGMEQGTWAAAGAIGQERAENRRPITLSYRGNIRGLVRQRILSGLKSLNRTDYSLESGGQVAPWQYMEVMASSKYCLHVRGTRVQSPRLYEALTFGCVPVIIADGYDLPLAWLLDWSAFAVIVPESQYDRLAEILDAADWTRLHDTLRRVLMFFIYHRTPIVGDAFWATMLGVQRQIERGKACEGIVSIGNDGHAAGMAADVADVHTVDKVLSDISQEEREKSLSARGARRLMTQEMRPIERV